ncbi:MAG: AarF/ABC1/UbiB kinase family protein [Myxococcota bacterium]|jgi:ubiquinone biosynthesis protein|nr:AarF/ABC1/UbiB kinase family protein [Myxococcota bacterium]
MASPVKTTIKDIRRLGDITGTLTKHGFTAVVRRLTPGWSEERKLLPPGEEESLLGGDRSSAAIRFRRVLEDLGPTFVKLGQVMSTRPDLVPIEFINELKSLQDNVPPLPFEQIEAQIEEALGKPPSEIYESIDEEPIGAASIGQVHLAKTWDGQDVVVKVQRPGIGEKIRADLDILYSLARILEVTIEEVELYSPTGIVREFSSALLKELDFTLEANNLEEFARNFADEPRVDVPSVLRELTTPTVLTMTQVKATKLSDIEGGTPRASLILDSLLDSVVKQVLYDGFFHGDPHPGNIFVKDDNTLVFIDFGMVGRLSAAQQDDTIDLIIAVLSGDVDTIARTLLKMGRPVGRVSMREFKADVVRIRDSYLLSNLSDINVTEFVQEVMDAAQYHRIQLNSSYAVLVKTASTIEGIMRTLEPELDLIGRATPYVRQLAARRFSARKIASSVLRNSMAFSSFVTQFPEQMDQILMDLENGNLSLNVRNDTLDKFGQHINTLGTRLFLGIIAAALAISASMLLQDFPYEVYGVAIRWVAGFACAAIASVLFWWALGWHIVGGKDSTKLRISPIVKFLRRGD